MSLESGRLRELMMRLRKKVAGGRGGRDEERVWRISPAERTDWVGPLLRP